MLRDHLPGSREDVGGEVGEQGGVSKPGSNAWGWSEDTWVMDRQQPDRVCEVMQLLGHEAVTVVQPAGIREGGGHVDLLLLVVPVVRT